MSPAHPAPAGHSMVAARGPGAEPMPHDARPTGAPAEQCQYLSKRELVKRSGLSAATVQRYVRAGKIPFYQPGGRGAKLLFPPNAIEAAVRQSTADPQAATGVTVVGVYAGPATAQSTRGSGVLPGPRPRWLTTRFRAQE